MAQTLDGRPIDVKPFFEQYVADTNRHMDSYNYLPMDTTKAHETRLFTASEKSVQSLEEGPAIVGEFYGSDALYVTDSEGVATGAASRMSNAHKGTVFEVRAKEPLNIIDLDKPLEGPALEVVKPYLDSAAIDTTKLDEPLTGKQVMEIIRDAIDRDEKLDESLLKQIHEELKAQGYDGFKHDGSSLMGMEHSKHNALVIFNKDKVEMVRRSDPGDAPLRKNFEEKAVAKTIADANKEDPILREPKVIEAHEKVMKGEDYTVEDAMKEVDSDIKDLKRASDREAKATDGETFLHPDDKAGIEELKRLETEGKGMITIYNMVKDCLLSGGA